MAIARVAGVAGAGSTSSSTTIAVAFSPNPQPNNLLIAVFEWGTSSAAPSSVADTRGNTWSLVGSVIADATNTQWMAMYAAVNSASAASANTVTATFAAGQTGRVGSIGEFSGQLAGSVASIIDGTPAGQKYTAASTTANIITPGTAITTTANGSLVFAGCGPVTAASVALGTGYTLNAYDAGDWLMTEYQIQSTAGAITPTFTPGSTGDYLVVAAAFKAAVTGPTPITGTDTGSLTEARSTLATSAVTDAGTLTDTAAVTAIQFVTATDTGTLTAETSGVVQSAGASGVDSGTLTESVALVVSTSLVDAGTLTDTRTTAAVLTGRTDTGALTDSAVQSVPSAARFITGVSADNRHLTDQHGAPIFAFHDVMWTLTAQSLADQEFYFADRAARGFNVVETTCTPFYYTSDGSSTYFWETRDGLEPFVGGDPTVPNSTYWARFDQTVALAEQYGLTLLVGAITDDITSSAGPWGPWSTGDSTSFGSFLGNRYKTAPNIVWLIGVDYNPSEWSGQNANFSACVTAMRAAGDTHLYTLQNYSVSISDTNTGLASLNWDIQGGYSYPWNAPLMRLGWNTNNGPTWDLEGDYEGENNQGGPSTVAYTLRALFGWALTHGGAGMGYGRHSVWRGDSTWKTDLGSSWILPLRRIVDRIQSISSWHKWVPDQSAAFVTAGAGTYAITSGTQTPSGEAPLATLNVDAQESDYATSAVAADGSGGAVYVPSNRTLTIDKTKIVGLSASYWVDASNASLTPTTATFTGNNVTSPGTNAAGDQDWFLIMEGTPALVGADSGSLTETRATVAALGRTDTGTGTEGTTGVAAASAVTDTGTLAEAVSIVVTSTSTDTGTGADTSAVSVVFVAVSTTDTGALTDTSSVNAGATQVSGTDSGGLAESVSIVVTLSGVDSGSGSDSSTVSQGGNPAVTDSGSLTESVTVSVVLTASDTGAGADTAGAPLAALSRVDSGTGSDTSAVNQSAGPQVTDVGALTESVSVAVVMSRTDQGTLTDTGVRVDLTNPAQARQTTGRIRGPRFTARISGPRFTGGIRG